MEFSVFEYRFDTRGGAEHLVKFLALQHGARLQRRMRARLVVAIC